MTDYSAVFNKYIPEVENFSLYSSTDSVTKDKVLSFRVEPGLFNLLEALTEKMDTGTVSKTARAIISMFLLPQIYKFELENMKPEKLSEVLNNHEEPGSFDSLYSFIEELEKYSAFLNEAEQKGKNSLQLIENEKQKVEKTVFMLEKTKKKWKELLLRMENKKM